MTDKPELSICPGCKGYSTNPCQFCGYDREGCEHCNWARRPGIETCPQCGLVLPAQLKLL